MATTYKSFFNNENCQVCNSHLYSLYAGGAKERVKNILPFYILQSNFCEKAKDIKNCEKMDFQKFTKKMNQVFT